MALASLRKVSKSYRLGTVDVPALQEVDLELHEGRFTVLCGPSGSGKTTLLNLIGCIDRPDRGEIEVAGQDLARLSDDALADFRARSVGTIFQTFNLLPVLSAAENIEMPLLHAVGLDERGEHRPGELSGGQRQRVAIARALAIRPKLVLADEPTANLDTQTGAQIIALMRKLQRSAGISFVFSSHDPQLRAHADDVVQIRDGRIESVSRREDGAEVPA
jgi:putative ABC transport system ATP-binding protein